MHLLRLSTRRKIRLAQAVHRIVRLGYQCIGRGMQGTFRRSGLQWNLNLDEGIDFAIWLFGSFERDLVRCYTHQIKPGSCVLDLGANIGAHTLPLARQVGPKGRVLAVEATTYAVEKLRANLALNPELSSRVTVVHALLMASPDAVAESHIHSSWPLAGRETTHPVMGGTLKAVGTARTCTVDQLITELRLPAVDWIKLDVDGHELPVLQGAEDTLRRHHPRIMMELAPYCHADHPGQFAALVEFLRRTGYHFHDPDSGNDLPASDVELLEIIPTNGSINILAVCRT